jgi:hypothetical protein
VLAIELARHGPDIENLRPQMETNVANAASRTWIRAVDCADPPVRAPALAGLDVAVAVVSHGTDTPRESP